MTEKVGRGKNLEKDVTKKSAPPGKKNTQMCLCLFVGEKKTRNKRPGPDCRDGPQGGAGTGAGRGAGDDGGVKLQGQWGLVGAVEILGSRMPGPGEEGGGAFLRRKRNIVGWGCMPKKNQGAGFLLAAQ